MHFLLIISMMLQTAVCLPSSSFPRAGKPQGLNLAQFHFDPFNLTDICVECKRDSPDAALFDCKIDFSWADPNAEKDCVCTNNWQWDGVTKAQGEMNSYSTNYLDCHRDGEEMFQFKFLNMTGVSSLSIMLSHIFRDYKDFPSPEVANLFATSNITLVSQEVTDTSIVYSLAGPVEAEITGVTI